MDCQYLRILLFRPVGLVSRDRPEWLVMPNMHIMDIMGIMQNMGTLYTLIANIIGTINISLSYISRL